MSSGKRKAGDQSSTTTDSAPKGLQKAVVREFLDRLLQPDRMGPAWLNNDEKQEWTDYLNGEPDEADEVAAEDWPLPGWNHSDPGSRNGLLILSLLVPPQKEHPMRCVISPLN